MGWTNNPSRPVTAPPPVVSLVASLPDPAASPPGVNDGNCHLTEAHPRPVILINGTSANTMDDYGALGPILANDGYCVFAPSLGDEHSLIQTTQSITTSAAEVAAEIDSVIAHYGGDVKVDLIGHSQGGTLALYVPKILHYAPKVENVVTLGAATHGTTVSGLWALAAQFPEATEALWGGICQACVDMLPDGPLMQALDSGQIAQPGVHYTVIATRYDLVSTPAAATFINEPGVTNEWIQDFCAIALTDHVNLPYDNTAIRLVLNALSPSTATAPDCRLALDGAVQQ